MASQTLTLHRLALVICWTGCSQSSTPPLRLLFLAREFRAHHPACRRSSLLQQRNADQVPSVRRRVSTVRCRPISLTAFIDGRRPRSPPAPFFHHNTHCFIHPRATALPSRCTDVERLAGISSVCALSDILPPRAKSLASLLVQLLETSLEVPALRQLVRLLCLTENLTG